MGTRPSLPQSLRALVSAASATLIAFVGIATVAAPAHADGGVPPVPVLNSIALFPGEVLVYFTPGAPNGNSAQYWVASCTSSDGGTASTGSNSLDPTDYVLGVQSLSLGKHYSCTVHATNASGDSAESTVSDSVVIVTQASPPTHLTATSGDHFVSYSFDPGFDGGTPIIGYVLHCLNMFPDIHAPSSPIVVTGLPNGQAIFCEVSATNSMGTGAPNSAYVRGSPDSLPSIPAIGAVSPVSAGLSVGFTWDYFNTQDVLGAKATCTSSDGGVQGSSFGGSSPITVALLTIGKTYTCTVHAINSVGDSAESGPSLAMIPDVAPGAPVINKVTKGDAQVTVAFSAGPDDGTPVTSFTVNCTSNTGVAGTASGAASPLIVTGLSNGATYTCKAHATNGIANSSDSGVSPPVVPDVPPEAPTMGTLSLLSGNEAAIDVTPADNGGTPVTGYVGTCTSSNGGAIRTSFSTGLPVLVPELNLGKTYTCTVAAFNNAGRSPDSAASNSVAIPVAPGAPTDVSAVSLATTTGTGSLIVNFEAPPSDGGTPIVGYSAICSSLDAGVTRANAISGASAAPITVSNLSAAKTYTCQVHAQNGVAVAGPSSVPSAPVIVGAPEAPTGAVARSNSTSASTGSLIVRYALGADNGQPITKEIATCSSSNGGVIRAASHVGAPADITVPALTTGRTYTCTVKALNARGASVSSAPSAAVIVGSPAFPLGVTVVRVAAGQIRVSFVIGSNNGAKILSSTAVCVSSDGGVNKSVTRAGATSGPIVVTGLTVGKSYACTVRSTNARGAGRSSNPSAAIAA